MTSSSIAFLGEGTETGSSLTYGLPTSFAVFSNSGAILIEPTSSLRTILTWYEHTPANFGEVFDLPLNLFVSSTMRPSERLALLHVLLLCNDRHNEVTIFGPPRLEQTVAELASHASLVLSPHNVFVEMKPSVELPIGRSLSITPIALLPSASGFEFGAQIVRRQERRVDPAKFERFGLAPGPEIGQIISGSTVRGITYDMIALDDQSPDSKVSYLPTRPDPAMAETAFPEGGTVVARIPYLDEHLDLGLRKGMLTSSEVGRSCAMNGVGRIVPVARSPWITAAHWLDHELEQFGVEVTRVTTGSLLSF